MLDLANVFISTPSLEFVLWAEGAEYTPQSVVSALVRCNLLRSETGLSVEGGKIVAYEVILKVTFVLEDGALAQL